MRADLRTWLVVAFVVAATSACSVPKDADFQRVERDAAARVGRAPLWNRGGARDRDVAAAVHRMLARPLGVAEAVQIALLVNPRLQATYEDLAVAQADVVQVGLLENPVFTAQYHVPISGGADTNHFDFGVEQDFLDVLLLPARKRLAGAAFEATKLRLGGAIVDFAFDVRVAYFTLHAAEDVARMRAAAAEAATAEVMLAEAQHAAGNIAELDLELQQRRVLRGEARAREGLFPSETAIARERLVRKLGLSGAGAALHLDAALPEIPASEPPMDTLEAVALGQRLDVASARAEAEARGYAVTMAKDFRWVPGVSLGADVDRESDGPLSAGPEGALTLPTFDQQQALVARLEAEQRRAVRALDAVAVAARSEVREAAARLTLARVAVDCTTAARRSPRASASLLLSLDQHDLMLLDAYQLLAGEGGRDRHVPRLHRGGP